MLQPGEEPCPIDPWIIVPDKSKFVDQQTLKLQENPEVRVDLLEKRCFKIYYLIFAWVLTHTFFFFLDMKGCSYWGATKKHAPIC